MKYMILTYGSQQDWDGLVGQGPQGAASWTSEDFEALGAFMHGFNDELAASGELVETRGLSAPVQARRIRGVDATAVTDGPYAETEEVLAGYWIVECDSFDRATEIAARLGACPGPEEVRARAYADVRPIQEHLPDAEG